MINEKPFTRYKLDDEKRDIVITVKFNTDERVWLDSMKRIIEQDKDSTALKQLAFIGSKVLLNPETAIILKTVFDNKRKNKRLGIIEYEV